MLKFVIIPLLIFLSTCEGEGNHDYFKVIQYIEIGKGNLNGSENIPQQNLVINDEESWNQLKGQMDAINDITSHFSEIEIDFLTDQIIAIFSNVKPNGGHSLNINFEENENNLVAYILEASTQGYATHLITQPFIIVKIPINTLPLVFINI